MTSHCERLACVARLAMVALVAMAFSAGCSSGGKAGPPTLPSGIDRVDINHENMNGPVPATRKTITDPDDIAALRDAVNQLPRSGKGAVSCTTDRGTWTLTFTGKGRRTAMTFDRSGCLEVQVRSANGTISERQGNEQLRSQLGSLVP